MGVYEVDWIAALPRLVMPGMVAYDVGANVGYYTLALSRLVGESGHVYSFEPESRNASALRRHIALNSLQNVTVVQAAVSEKLGMVHFEGEGSSGKIDTNGHYLIPSTSLDEFARDNPSPDFVKVDIEGAEVDALAGAGSILSRTPRPSWMVATHFKNSINLWQECQSLMARHGYRFSNTGGDFIAEAS
jgi:FkbM family methyltransferase